MQKISDLVSKSQVIPNKKLEHSYVVHTIWKEITSKDKDLEENISIKEVKGDTLYLSSKNPIWAQEVQLNSEKYIKEINSLLPLNYQNKISKIVIFNSSY